MRASGMTMEREAKILESAISWFGKDAQIDKTIEEMAELTKALLKHRDHVSERTTDAVLEELADVGIMLNQMALIFGDCTGWEIEKLTRLEARIASEEREIKAAHAEIMRKKETE